MVSASTRKLRCRHVDEATLGAFTIGATIFELEGKRPEPVPPGEEVPTYRQLVIEYQPTYDPEKLWKEIQEQKDDNARQRGG